MEQTNRIHDALQQLDPENDSHWTGDGMPRLEVLKDLGVDVTRKQVTEAAPNFTREAAKENSDGDRTEEAEAPPEVNDPVAVIDEQLEEIRSRRNKIDTEMATLERAKAELIKEEDRLTNARNNLAPAPNQAEAIQQYLETQKELRKRRFAGAAKLEDLAGGKLPGSIAQAPIDQVRRRQVGHGNQKKAYPALNPQRNHG